MHKLIQAAALTGFILYTGACSSGLEDDAKTLEPSPSFDAVFNLYDSNKDGMVSPDELATVEKSQGSAMTEEKALSMFETYDMSGDGFLDKVEFTGPLNKKILAGARTIPSWSAKH
jgi:Ca2+-binding EF-hand superfamily protein